MALDVNRLLDELGATGEDRTAVESFFTKNPTAAQKASDWRENGLRQSDYDRKMNMLKAEVDADKARVSQAEATILASRDTMNSQYTQALADREAAENRLAQTTARINRVATEYNIPVTEFGIDGTQTQQTQQTQPPRQQQNDDHVSRQDFNTVLELTKKLPMLPVQLMKLQREHFELFGTSFDEEAVVNKALELKKPLAEVADLMFGMSAKRVEKHDAQIRQDERAKADAEWKTKVSQNAVNPIRTDLNVKPGPVFELKRPEALQGIPGPRPDRLQSGVEGAVSAFREGKYRPQEKSA